MSELRIEKPIDKPCVCAGGKLYTIGAQDGTFPQKGEHLSKEMWGVWCPPIKLLDGYWLKINEDYLTKSDTYIQLPYGNKFLYKKDDIEIERLQFVPSNLKGLIVEVKLTNTLDTKNNFHFTFVAKTDLVGTWLTERLGQQDGSDMLRRNACGVVAKDEHNPWYAGISGSKVYDKVIYDIVLPCDTYGLGKTFALENNINLKPFETVTLKYVIAGSNESEEDLERTKNLLQNTNLLEKEIEKYSKINERAELILNQEPLLSTIFEWTKYNNEWLWLDVDGIGKGYVAGFPEFPWWFGHDSTYFIQALLMTGDYEKCKSTLRLVKRYSLLRNQDSEEGRVVHEISNNGQVFYEGMMTETPQFCHIVYELYNWTGDLDFLIEMYDFCKQGVNWLYRENVSDNCSLPIGYGVTEIAGLNLCCLDTAAFGVKSIETLMFMAKVLGKNEDYKIFSKQFEIKKAELEKLFWINEKGIYGDMVGTPEEIMERAKSWKKSLKGFPIEEDDNVDPGESCKADKLPEDEETRIEFFKHMDEIIEEAEASEKGVLKPWLLFSKVNSILPIIYGYADSSLGIKIMDELAEEVFSCEYGRTGFLKDPLMSIGVGRLAKAEGSIGRSDMVLKYLHLFSKIFGKSAIGSTSEIPPDKGCFVQMWNNYISMWPYADTFFGIRPNAQNCEIHLDPCMPTLWTELKIMKLYIGDGIYDLSFESGSGKKIINIKKHEGSWKWVSDNDDYEICQK